MRSMERCRKAELYGPDGHILCEALVSAGPFDDLITFEKNTRKKGKSMVP